MKMLRRVGVIHFYVRKKKKKKSYTIIRKRTGVKG